MGCSWRSPKPCKMVGYDPFITGSSPKALKTERFWIHKVRFQLKDFGYWGHQDKTPKPSPIITIQPEAP